MFWPKQDARASIFCAEQGAVGGNGWRRRRECCYISPYQQNKSTNQKKEDNRSENGASDDSHRSISPLAHLTKLCRWLGHHIEMGPMRYDVSTALHASNALESFVFDAPFTSLSTSTW